MVSLEAKLYKGLLVHVMGTVLPTLLFPSDINNMSADLIIACSGRMKMFNN